MAELLKNSGFYTKLKAALQLQTLKNLSTTVNKWMKLQVSPNVADVNLQLDTLGDTTQQPNNVKLSMKERLSSFIIDPNLRLYYCWLFFFSICYFYNLIFLIARTVFWELQNSQDGFVWYILDYAICDLIYLLDILIKFRTGFMKDGELCDILVDIRHLYTHSIAFKMDLLSLVPTDLLYFALPTDYKRFLPALRLNRLLRFFRFKEFLTISETQTSFPNMFRMANLIINILLLIHWNACIYFLLSYIIGFGTDDWVYPALTTESEMANQTLEFINNQLWTHTFATQYIFCLWWSTLTLTTIAEVNAPENYYEEIYMAFLLMLGVIILATVIGSTRNMFANANLQRESLQNKCDSVKEFLKMHRIDDKFGSRVQTYFDYLWSSPNLDQQDSVLDCLPSKLCDELAMNIHMETLKSVKLFQDCEPGLLRELVSRLKLKLFSPGDYVCRKGDIGREMYFIKTGKLEVVSDDGQQRFAVLNSGAAFGEISILDIPGNKNGNKRTANIRSVGFTDLFQLTKDDLWSVLSEYPLAKQILLEKGKSLLSKDNLIDEELAAKVERRSKPVYMQAEHLEDLLKNFNSRLDEALNIYVDFLNRTKQKITHLEKTYKK